MARSRSRAGGGSRRQAAGGGKREARAASRKKSPAPAAAVEVVEEEKGMGVDDGIAIVTAVMLVAGIVIIDMVMGKYLGGGTFF